ncbi:hypothetical protein CDD83_1469 [Cordyceps sp. RAO-2017]|nr:hypothetical protein CDD83_1469 [Cordyceps sp. RAO-2017]
MPKKTSSRDCVQASYNPYIILSCPAIARLGRTCADETQRRRDAWRGPWLLRFGASTHRASSVLRASAPPAAAAATATCAAGARRPGHRGCGLAGRDGSPSTEQAERQVWKTEYYLGRRERHLYCSLNLMRQCLPPLITAQTFPSPSVGDARPSCHGGRPRPVRVRRFGPVQGRRRLGSNKFDHDTRSTHPPPLERKRSDSL